MAEQPSSQPAPEPRGWTLTLRRFEEAIVARERERQTQQLAEHEQEIRARERRRIGALIAPPIPSTDFDGCLQ